MNRLMEGIIEFGLEVLELFWGYEEDIGQF